MLFGLCSLAGIVFLAISPAARQGTLILLPLRKKRPRRPLSFKQLLLISPQSKILYIKSNIFSLKGILYFIFEI